MRLLLGLTVLLAGCIDTAQSDARVALYASGSDVSEPFRGRGGVTIELTRAELAFGPLTLCAGSQAGELCDEAVLEWRAAAVVDALDPEPRRAGTLVGVTGAVRSYMYDLGLASLLTQTQPLVLPAARELAAHSLVLEGMARRGAEALPFVIEVAISQGGETEQGVPVVRSGVSEAIDHEVARRGERLLVRFDPRPWLTSVDFATAIEACATDGGCDEPVDLSADPQVWLAVRNAVVAGQRPLFVWNHD